MPRCTLGSFEFFEEYISHRVGAYYCTSNSAAFVVDRKKCTCGSMYSIFKGKGLHNGYGTLYLMNNEENFYV